MPSPELDRIVALLRAIPRREAPSVASMRRGFNTMSSMSPVPGDVRFEAVTLGGIAAERVVVPGADPDRALLFLHGGGFVVGSPLTHRELVARIARAAGVTAFVPDYRLAPEHPFPAGIEDSVAAYRALIELGFAPDRVAIAGDSAGGGLTVASLIALRDAGDPLPSAAVCLSPWVDLTLTGGSIESRAAADPWVDRAGLAHMARHYLAGADPTHPLASPILADLSRLPPLLVHVGAAEVLHDDAARLAERAQQHGVEVVFEAWEAMVHVWHAFPLLPEAHQATTRIGRFLRARLGA